MIRAVSLFAAGATCVALALLFGLIADGARVAEEWCFGMAARAAYAMGPG